MPEKKQNKAFKILKELVDKGQLYQDILSDEKAMFVSNDGLRAVQEIGIIPAEPSFAIKEAYRKDFRYDISKLHMIKHSDIVSKIEKSDPGNPDNSQLVADIYITAKMPPYKDEAIDKIIEMVALPILCAVN